MKFLAIIFVFLLSGCVSPQQQAEQQAQSFCATKKDKEFYNCYSQIYPNYFQAAVLAQQQRQMSIQAMGQGMAQTGSNYYNNQTQYYAHQPVQQAPSMQQTQCRMNGNLMTCESY